MPSSRILLLRLAVHRVFLAAFLAGGGLFAEGATYTWTSSSAANWDASAANWGGAGIPGSTDDVATPTGFGNLQVDGARTINSLTDSSGTSWSIQATGSGASLGIGTLNAGSPGGTLSIENSSGNSSVLTLSIGTLNVTGGTVALGGNNATLRLGQLTVTGTTAISSGILSINSANATLADVVMSAGTSFEVNTQNYASAAGGATVASLSGSGTVMLLWATPMANLSGTLTINGSSTATFAGVVRDDPSTGSYTTQLGVAKSGTGTQTLSGNNSYTGTTTVSGGTLILSGANTTTGAVTVSGGRLEAGSAGALGTGAVTVNGTGALATTAASVNASGLTLASADASLTLNGASTGVLALAAGTSFSMSAGTLYLSGSGASSYDKITGSGAGTFTLSGGTVDLGGNTWNYGATYALFSGFSSGSVSGIVFTDYDTADWQASLSNAGVLSFLAVPEPPLLWLAGGGLLLLACRRGTPAPARPA